MSTASIQIVGSAGQFAPHQLWIFKFVAVTLAVTSPLWVGTLIQFDGTDQGLGLFWMFLVLGGSATALVMNFRGDSVTQWVFLSCLMAKVAASSAYLYLCNTVYRANDAFGYFDYALKTIRQEHWEWAVPLWGTNAINNFTALLLSLFGPSLPAAFITYAVIGFWGQFCLYKAFCIVFPNGYRALAMPMLLLMPSLIFWPSPIGKDAVVLFGLGLATYGFALFNSSRSGFFPLFAGMVLVAIVRPHIAAVYAVSVSIAFLVVRQYTGIQGLLIKFAGLPVLIAAAVYLVGNASNYLDVDNVNQGVIFANRIQAVGGQLGASDFGMGESLAVRLMNAPFLLIRPFLWEVHNTMALLASLEGMLLAALLGFRWKALFLSLKGSLQNPFVLFILLYSAGVIFSLAGVVSNFGTLARQRVMVTPFLLMLLCLAPVPRFSSRQERRSGFPVKGKEAFRGPWKRK